MAFCFQILKFSGLICHVMSVIIQPSLLFNFVKVPVPLRGWVGVTFRCFFILTSGFVNNINFLWGFLFSPHFVEVLILAIKNRKGKKINKQKLFSPLRV